MFNNSLVAPTYRPMTWTDVPAIASLEATNAEHIARFMARPPDEPAQAVRKWAEAMAQSERGVEWHAVLVDEDLIIGACSLTPWPPASLRDTVPAEPDSRELQAWIDAGHSGRGVAKLISDSLQHVAFGRLGLASVVIRIDPAQAASLTLSRRAGFEVDHSVDTGGRWIVQRLRRPVP